MADEKDPFDTLSGDTLRKAEEMCSGLGLGLSLERRGQSILYRGAVADLDDRASDDTPVTVAEVGHDPGFTLIVDHPMEACARALLVFRRPPTQDVRYLGHHQASRPGNRGEEDQGRHIVHFNIERQLDR